METSTEFCHTVSPAETIVLIDLKAAELEELQRIILRCRAVVGIP